MRVDVGLDVGACVRVCRCGSGCRCVCACVDVGVDVREGVVPKELIISRGMIRGSVTEKK